MIRRQDLVAESSMQPPAVVSILGAATKAALFGVPFVVKWLAGFEWAVLVAISLGTLYAVAQIGALIRGVMADTTCINLMKQYEHKLWDPHPSDRD